MKPIRYLLCCSMLAAAAGAAAQSPAPSEGEAAGEVVVGPLVAVEATQPELSEAPPFPAECHPWARFEPGAYRITRTTTQTFNPDGSVLGTSDTTLHEVLKAVADDTYVLEVKASVDLDGKEIVGEWKTRVLRIATDEPGRELESAALEDAVVEIDGEPINCRVWQRSYVEERGTREQTLYFSQEDFPHVLRRVSSSVASGAEEQAAEEEAAAGDSEELWVSTRTLPVRVSGRLLRGAAVRWSRLTAKGRSTRLSSVCKEVPGGEVAWRSTDLDTEGRVVRWSVTELVDFGDERRPSGESASAGASLR